MMQFSFCVDSYYWELRVNGSVVEKFDYLLKIFTALELIVMLKHTAVGLQAWLPLRKDGKQKN
jgi:hypothetical protein